MVLHRATACEARGREQLRPRYLVRMDRELYRERRPDTNAYRHADANSYTNAYAYTTANTDARS